MGIPTEDFEDGVAQDGNRSVNSPIRAFNPVTPGSVRPTAFSLHGIGEFLSG
jgi:hypothetical protein